MTSSIARPAQQRAEDDDEAPRPVPTDPYKNARYKGGRDPVSGIAPNLDGTLPEPPPPQRKAQSAGAGRAIAATRAQTVAIAQPSASASSVVAGPTVQVQPGDTLSKIARTNGVSVTALMQVNGLSTPAIMAGQTLVLPPK